MYWTQAMAEVASFKACRSLAPLSWVHTTWVTCFLAKRGQTLAPCSRATFPKEKAESPPPTSTRPSK
eukprot:Skav207548  [mRNA]  locus=scaffold2295:79336:81520:- [translate_table: standard]